MTEVQWHDHRRRDLNDPQRQSGRGLARHRYNDRQSLCRVFADSTVQITQNSKAAYYYSPSKNIVYVTQAGAVLSGINFGAATVVINANNVTIKDSTFTGTTGFWAVYQSAAL